MNNIKNWVQSFLADEEGASAIEYALIAAMVAIALITFVTPIRNAITAIFSSISNALTGAVT